MKLQALTKVVRTPSLKMAYCVGGTFDIPNHITRVGKDGETYIIGGRPEICSIAAFGNAYKTAFSNYFDLSVLDAILSAQYINYDTEMTLTNARMEHSCSMFPTLKGINLELEGEKESPRIILCRSADIPGEAFFDIVKDVSKERYNNREKLMRTLPFADAHGNPIRMPAPFIFKIDSISMMSFTAVDDKIYEDASVGEGAANIGFMKDGGAKAQMFVQLPNVVSRGSLMFGMVAHVGSTIDMGKYAPQPQKLAFAKAGQKTKGVPEKFSFINDLLLEIQHVAPLLHPADRSPMYPYTEADREKGNDLFKVRMISTRNKSGPTGVEYNIIVSQKYGVQATLSEVDLCKEAKRWGIGGNAQRFYLDMLPDVVVQRTTIRTVIAETPAFRTAARLTAELLQLRRYSTGIDDILCTPKELYDDITAMGYDWNKLLDTDYRVKFKEDRVKEDKNFLSIYDLLNMRQGTYKPKWHGKLEKPE